MVHVESEIIGTISPTTANDQVVQVVHVVIGAKVPAFGETRLPGVVPDPDPRPLGLETICPTSWNQRGRHCMTRQGEVCATRHGRSSRRFVAKGCTDQIKTKWARPQSTEKKTWRIMLSAALQLYSSVTSAFYVAFLWSADLCVIPPPTIHFDVVVDTFFLAEILLHFFTGVHVDVACSS